MSEASGTIFNIQRFSVDDGPGIRTTVFLKGCPLSCLWCHNPESNDSRPEIFFDLRKCVYCRACEMSCPQRCHSVFWDADGTARHTYDRSTCIRCGKCADVCHTEALSVSGKCMTVSQVLFEVEKDKIFYDQSGGGMTLSGGEPLAQGIFTAALCEAAKKADISVALETSGFGSREILRQLLLYTDLFLFDYKAEPEDYQKLTGVPFDRIGENLSFLSENGGRIVLRCPIIPGINDREAHYDGIALLAKKLPGVESVTLEAYHPMGISKAQQLGKKMGYENMEFLDKKSLFPVRDRIASLSGKPCIIG